jgi:ketosteroid isomerase-like protein
MKAVSSVLLVLALVPLSACAPKVNDPADVQAVKQTMEAYTKGIVAKDAPASVAMMTDKTAYFEPHFPAMTGKEAVAKFFKMAFEQFEIEMVPVVTDVQVEGNLALMHGTYTQKLTPKAEGAAAMPDSGNWTVAARRQADGSWKWDWIMGASDQPMPGTTADGAEEQAVMQTVRELGTAVVKRDMAALDRLAAKERNLFEDGQAVDVAKANAEFKSGAIRIDSDTVRELRVYVFGDAAITTGVGETKGAFKGKDFSGPYRATNFYLKRNGQWQLVSGQSSSIKQ